jgi:hypothetical protein
MNSKWHFYTSLIKSLIRAAGCLLAVLSKRWEVMATTFLIAEILGVLEEIKDER